MHWMTICSYERARIPFLRQVFNTFATTADSVTPSGQLVLEHNHLSSLSVPGAGGIVSQAYVDYLESKVTLVLDQRYSHLGFLFDPNHKWGVHTT